jgi:hypothetical protein
MADARYLIRGGVAWKARPSLFFLFWQTGIVVFVVSCVVTFSNIGLRADLVIRWLSAFFIGWPVASLTGLVAFPYVRRATTGIVALIERA